jgi:hypothetical protein
VSYVPWEGEPYIYLPSEFNGHDLLNELLKDLIVNLVGLSRKGVKRLTTLDKRLNHDS